MAVSKVVLGDETLIDLTGDSVSSENLLQGATAHAANGEQITGGVVVTPMYTGTKSAIEEAIALGQIPEDAVVNITDDEETSSFQTQIDEINSSLGDISNIGNTTYNSVEKILQYYIDNGYLPDLKSIALIPVMTSNTTPSGVASAISEYSNCPAYYAFRNLYDDTSSSESWQANDSIGTSHSNLWLMYKFPKAVTVKKFRISFVYTTAVNYKIQGSNDGSTFTDLGTFTTMRGTEVLQNTNSYLYYRLFIISQTSINSNMRGGCVRDLQLYGY